MEACWNRATPQQRFWIRLRNQRVDQLISDPERVLLKHMRHDHAMVKRHQKLFGPIFKERGLCLYKLIAEACGENWDSEDEQKNCPPMEPKKPNKHAFSLDCPREERVREGESEGDVVQAGDDRRQKIVQARRRRGSTRGGSGRAQEEAPRQKKKAEVGGRGTVGVGNVEEGRLAEVKPRKKRERKRPHLSGKGYTNIN